MLKLLFKLSLVAYLLTFNALIGALETNKIVAVLNQSYVVLNTDVTTKQKALKLLNKNISYQESLDHIISNYFFIDAANKFSIGLTQQEFDSTLDTYVKSNNTNVKLLLEKAAAAGVSNNTFLTALNEEYLVEKIKQVLIFNLSRVSEKEVDLEIEKMLALNNQAEFELKQISISNSETAEKLIDNIYNKLLKGENFNNLAKTYSQDFYASNGGNIGFVAATALPSAVLDEIASLNKTKFTKPIFINNTYKIYYVVQSRDLLNFNPKDPTHIDQLRAYAKQKITYEKGEVVLDDFLKSVIANSTIVYY